MKKLLSLVAIFGLFVAFNAQAEDNYVLGGFEASGHVVTGAGYQTLSKQGTAVGANDLNGNFPGVLGSYIDNSAAGTKSLMKKDHELLFFVDEVELDLSKTFGENVRFRSDLDFGAAGTYSRSGLNGVSIEQAYTTANVPVGNGLEILLGRFNTPMGFEAVDTSDRDTISASGILRAGLRPVNSTGAKLYYAFSDMFDLHFYFINDLTHDSTVAEAGKRNVAADEGSPAAGLRFGFTWGEEGSENMVGVSAAAGNENAPGAAGKKLTYIGDLDFSLHFGDAFSLGGEVLYRTDGAPTGGVSAKYLAGLLNLNYDFSDVWDGTFKYGYTNDVKGTTATAGTANLLGGGAGGMKTHEISLATGYSIADGATFKVEAGYNTTKADGGVGTYAGYGVGGAFSYNF